MVTLDAVLENPQNWSFDYWNDDIQQYVRDQLFTSDVLIMGRITYEGFAEAWSARAGADEFADRINSLPKLVASRTLKQAEWNATVMTDVAGEVAALKGQPGQNILQYGMGELTYTLLEHGLVDELRFLVYPVTMGEGKRILEGIAKTAMTLIQTQSFDTGVLALHYAPKQQD
jgi:dihydrofolate reductase